MSGPFVRKLNFKSYNLGSKATLVLTFDDEKIPGIYKDVFPTAFKVTEFAATGAYGFQAKYKAQLGFTRAQISSDNKVEPASTYIPINVGEKTKLTKDGNSYSFSTPTDIKPSQQIVAQNEAPGRENIGVGFFVGSPEDAPSTILLFQGVGSTSSAQVQFTPILRAYITTDYQETQILRGQVTSPILFNRDLTQLEEETNWKITYNAGSGKFQIDKV
jgi:hypothetical protein